MNVPALPPPVPYTAGMFAAPPAYANNIATQTEQPNMFRQIQACTKCKMYPGQFVPAAPVIGAADAKLLVIYDSPNKKDAKQGQYMAEEAGTMFYSAVGPWAQAHEVCVYPAVRCFLHRVNAKTNEAKACWRNSGMQDFMSAYPQEKTAHNKRVLLLGFWPCKLVTGRDIKELHGKVLEDGDVRYGVARSPAYFVAKHVRWVKEDGRWFMSPSDGMIRAENEWRAHILPVMQQLYAGTAVSVQVSGDIQFPYVSTRDHDKFVRILQERENKLLHIDLETYPSPAEEAKGRSALDWFYGPETCRPLCLGVSLFDNLEDTKYTDTKYVPDYDPNKVVVYTGQLTPEIGGAIAKTKLYAFNATYDTGVLYQHTKVAAPVYADPCDMGYVINQARKKYSLESLAFEYVPAWSSWGGAIKGKFKNFSYIPKAQLLNYNAGDNAVSSVMFFKFQQEIHRLGMDFVYWNIHAGTKNVLRDMELLGLNIDYGYWKSICANLTEKVRDCESRLETSEYGAWIQQQTGKPLNPRSNQQLLKILQHAHGADKFTATGKEALEDYVKRAGDKADPFVADVLKFRDVDKAYGIYVKTFANIMDKDREHPGRALVYTSFKTNTTETGRSSSGGGDPVGLGRTKQINIQNIPRGGGLRRLFIARPGCKLAYADYSQIEVRVAGAYARSTEIAAVCKSDRDFHGAVASLAFKIPYEEVMDEDARIKEIGGTSNRTKAKTITFGLIYGMQAQALARKLSCTEEEAERFIADYFAGMPSIKSFIDTTHAFARENLFVRTSFGRIRRFDNASNATMRESVNTLVQASASDIFQLSLQASSDVFKREGLYRSKVFPWCQVHDSQTFEFASSIPDDEIRGMMSYAMTTHVRKMFPIVDDFMGEIPLDADFKFDTVWH